MSIRTVIFDLDGTLLDTTEGILESAQYAARQLGYECLTNDEWLDFIGPPIQNSFMKHFGVSKEQSQVAANIFRDYYKTQALMKATPYNGIFDLCRKLKNAGINEAVATYKREDYARQLLNHFQFDHYCFPMHGGDNNNVLTKADIISKCIHELDENPENCVLVGDTVHDAIGAQKVGIQFIGVTYGFGFKSERDIQKYPNIGICHVPLDIFDLVISHNRC